MHIHQRMPAPFSTPGKKPSPLLREVVDQANTPLCLLPEALILRQKLCHRAVALLICDHAGRVLLQPRPGIGWDLSSFALPLAAEASEDCVCRLLREEWKLQEPVPRIINRLEACAETGMAFLTLFSARISSAKARHLASPGVIALDGLPLVDAIELAGLAEQSPPLLSPMLLQAVRFGWLERIWPKD